MTSHEKTHSIIDDPNQQRYKYKPQTKGSNDIDVFRLLAGKEKRTTVMIRNIPNKFKQKMLLDMINVYHLRKYDYFYLPMDLKVR